MGMTTKPQRDADSQRAINEFLENGGRVKLRGVDHKKVRANYKFGGRGRCFAQLVTMGFNEKVLRD